MVKLAVNCEYTLALWLNSGVFLTNLGGTTVLLQQYGRQWCMQLLTLQCMNSCLPETKESERKHRNLLVLLNPFAGDQKGEQKFNRVVRPMFDLAEINYTVQITGKP